MKEKFKHLLESHFGVAFVIAFIALSTFTLTRLTLLVYSAEHVKFSFFLIYVAVLGMLFDLAVISFFLIPVILFLMFWPTNWLTKTRTRVLNSVLIFTTSAFLLFESISEVFFWEEFGTRFNFIAVDYLIYTTEVIGNIQQSYPLEFILPVIVILASGFTWWIQRKLNTMSTVKISRKLRVKWVATFLIIPAASLMLSSGNKQISTNPYLNEIATNGVFELFSAFRNNELDYETFYKTNSIEESFRVVRDLLKTPEATFTSNRFSLERVINNPKPERKLNVVLISVESLSASFMATFGNKKNITPTLDSLVNHALVFTKLYATGTRTVRGLEALSLSTPPTPGQSIVRRPHNENMFTLGSVFKSKGYSCKYIYGGYGYFDNMNYFFEHNNYDVKDRLAISDDRIHHENVWGVADEDLFDLAKDEINASIETGKPVFTHIMTTSNHRPYTYPDKRIDIPSGSGRAGAVKYTDYAIGKFIKDCSKESWFNSTVFIIVADHCASSAGETDLPVSKYHIPLLIFSPQNIQPQKVDYLMSQIDVAPTLLGLLNFSYTSNFFGYDIFKTTPSQRRAFISTYQLLGYIKNDDLIILSPQHHSNQYHLQLTGNTTDQRLIKENPKLVNEAIDWYETASYAFKHHVNTHKQ